MRRYGDLDLLVRQRDIRRARELMIGAGYESRVPLRAITAGKIPGQYLFSQPEKKQGMRIARFDRLVLLHQWCGGIAHRESFK